MEVTGEFADVPIATQLTGNVKPTIAGKIMGISTLMTSAVIMVLQFFKKNLHLNYNFSTL